MNRSGTWFAIALGALVLALAGCTPRRAATHGADATADAPLITIVRAMPEAGGSLVLPARVAAREEVVVTARVAARLTETRFRDGDRFRRGQILASFDAPEARQAMLSAGAALDAATLRAEQARRQESRMDSLFADRVASQRERELAQAERLDAEAALTGARARLSELSSGLAIPAPFDGVVVRRLIDVGLTVGPGQPVMAIRSQAVGEIVAVVPESDLPRLERGRFAFQIADGPWRDAELVRIEGMTDYTTRTRVARFKPRADNGTLEAGAFARLRIVAARGAETGGDTTSQAGILSIPTGSLVRRGALTGVYVVREGHAHLRWLKLGAEEGDRVAVLSGLDHGDSIAADPAGLSDGQAVRVAR